jgi:hypothetical protein
MNEEYLFYETDESFTYADWGLGYCTVYNEVPHGFEIDIDNGKIIIESIKGLGDYEEMSNIKTLQELWDYLREHINETDTIDQMNAIERLMISIENQLKEVA